LQRSRTLSYNKIIAKAFSFIGAIIGRF